MNRSLKFRVFTRFTITLLLFLAFAGSSWAADVQVSNAPENNLSLTVSSISGARKSIFLNIYELSSADIANALMDQINAGIQVVILEEGSPVGGMSTAAKGIESSLANAMKGKGQDHFFRMAKIKGPRRYRFDHAKYAVIDDEWLLIGSENYSPTGNPSPGSLGNRGWEVFIHDATIAQNYQSVFATDATTQYGDVTDLSSNPFHLVDVTSENQDLIQKNAGLTATQITRITSPDSSLSGLLSLIQNAKQSIDLEQMTFDSTWNKTAGASPLTAAVIAAAKRGVKVRVLLNNEHVFDHPGHPAVPHNTDTVALFTQAGVEARIANLSAMGVDYIHNKGMLVDGKITLISSINWDQNSIQHNREAAVAITSPAVNQYYTGLFEKDWRESGGASFSKADAVSAGAFTCPHQVHLKAAIATLSIQDSEDSDFNSLSGKTIEEDFVVDQTLSGCTFVREADQRRIQERQFVELRSRRDGTISLNFEGYTPNTKKLYSIRAIYTGTSVDGSNKATLFDGSGSREALGAVKLEVKTK